MAPNTDTTESTASEETTLADAAYHELICRITLGELSPGFRLTESAVCDMLGVSRTPVREAMTRLLHDGLLVSLPGRGVVVRELTDRDIEELYCVREGIETQAARKAAERITDDELQELYGLCDQMDSLSADDPLAVVYRGREIDAQFHLRLVELSGVSALADIYRRQRLIHLHIFGHHRSRFSDLYHLSRSGRGARHRRIVDALATRDPIKADEAIRKSMAESMQLVRDALMRRKKIGASLRQSRQFV